MKLAAVSIVRNEQDIIESFVHHTLRYADHLTITLHRSNDETERILLKLQEEGLPLTLHATNEEIFRGAECRTAMMRESVERFAPQWILPLDADEFLGPDVEQVHKVLKMLPTNRVTLIHWRTYVPTLHDDVSLPIPERITHRRKWEPMQYYKVLIPLQLACKPSTIISPGSHELKDSTKGESYPVFKKHPLFLAHYPVRSPEQLRRKVVNGWESRLADLTLRPGLSYHWQHLYERCCTSAPINAKELQLIALSYAVPDGQEPTPDIIKDPFQHLAPR